MRSAYTYTILRYVHDSMTGEFVNVGVVVCSPSQRYLKASIRHTYGGRISTMFPGIDGRHFHILTKQVELKFADWAGRLQEDLSLEEMPENALSAAHKVLPADDSAFQWSEMGSGLSTDLDETLTNLFQRIVMKYDEKNQSESRSDEVIWQSFKSDFEQHRILSSFTSKTISSDDGEVEFKHAWENGQWHCLEPVSFDLVNPTSITDKACTWLGKMVNLRESREPFKVYFLVGEPRHDECRVAFEKALVTLRKSPHDPEIIRESESQRFSMDLAQRITEHAETGE